MSDDSPILAALARIEAEQSRISVEQSRIRELVNTKLEPIFDDISTLRTEFQHTKGFLLEDAIVLGRRTLSIDNRLSSLERKLPD